MQCLIKYYNVTIYICASVIPKFIDISCMQISKEVFFNYKTKGFCYADVLLRNYTHYIQHIHISFKLQSNN